MIMILNIYNLHKSALNSIDSIKCCNCPVYLLIKFKFDWITLSLYARVFICVICRNLYYFKMNRIIRTKKKTQSSFLLRSTPTKQFHTFFFNFILYFLTWSLRSITNVNPKCVNNYYYYEIVWEWMSLIITLILGYECLVCWLNTQHLHGWDHKDFEEKIYLFIFFPLK